MRVRTASKLPVEWVKSTASGVGNCVELGEMPDGTVAMRDSKEPDGPALVFSRPEMAALIAGVKDGEFDRFAC